MTTIVFNIKIGEVENKIPYVIDLVKKSNYDTEISGIDRKHFTTAVYNKITSDILDAKIKKELVKNSDISNLNSDLIKILI